MLNIDSQSLFPTPTSCNIARCLLINADQCATGVRQNGRRFLAIGTLP